MFRTNCVFFSIKIEYQTRATCNFLSRFLKVIVSKYSFVSSVFLNTLFLKYTFILAVKQMVKKVERKHIFDLRFYNFYPKQISNLPELGKWLNLLKLPTFAAYLSLRRGDLFIVFLLFNTLMADSRYLDSHGRMVFIAEKYQLKLKNQSFLQFPLKL